MSESQAPLTSRLADNLTVPNPGGERPVARIIQPCVPQGVQDCCTRDEEKTHPNTWPSTVLDLAMEPGKSRRMGWQIR